MEVEARWGYWNGKNGILGERYRLCSDEKVEEQGAGSGIVGLSIWTMCKGEQAQKNKPRERRALKSSLQ